MVSASLFAAIAITATATAAGQHSAPTAANSTDGQANLRGSSGAQSSAPAPSEMLQASGVIGQTDHGAQVPSTTTTTTAIANATEPDRIGRELAGFLDWGHGHKGETCCMCSYQFGGPTGTVTLYAAEDYDNFRGGHNAFWHCEHECEHKCGGRRGHAGGHKFGCLDEHHLRSLTKAIGHTRGFRIEHQHRFGNLC